MPGNSVGFKRAYLKFIARALAFLFLITALPFSLVNQSDAYQFPNSIKSKAQTKIFIPFKTTSSKSLKASAIKSTSAALVLNSNVSNAMNSSYSCAVPEIGDSRSRVAITVNIPSGLGYVNGSNGNQPVNNPIASSINPIINPGTFLVLNGDCPVLNFYPALGYNIGEVFLGSHSFGNTASLSFDPTNLMNPNDSSSATGPVTSSKTVSVTFVKQIHHVFYNANGGSGNVPSDNANYSIGDSVIVKSDIPTRDGFTFAGWTLDSGNSGAVYSAGQSITFGATDITFYAKWAVTKFQLNYSASTGGSISGVNPQTVDYGVDGSEVIATPDLHYHFTGWSDSVITPSRRELNVTRNVSVTASFSINSNTVTYNGNGNDTGIAPMDPVSHDYSTAVTVLTRNSLVKNGYEFIGWNTAANGSGTTFAENSTFNIGDAPVVLYAQWRALPSNGGGGGVAIENYQITYKSGGGVGTAPNGPTTYAYGTPFNLPENTFARIGHQFIGWTEDISHRIYKARDTFPATQGNVSFTATWSRNTYSISYAPGDGIGEGPKEPTKFIYGDNFSLPKCEADCYTRTGYTFTGWNDGNNTYKPEDIYTTSTSNLIFTAIWSQEIAPIVITPGTPKITIKTLPSYTNHAVKYASVKAHYEVVDTTAHTYNLGVVHDKGSSLRFTEDVIKSVDGKLIFKVTDTGIAVTAINGWTGKITVPAVAVRDNQEIELFIGITENPGAVLKPVINVNNVKQEVITWKKDGSQVVGYVVTNGAKTICKTTSLKCTINNGTNGTLNIKIKALGRDNTASVSVKPDVTPNNFKVLFNTNSYTITAQYQAVLKNVIRIAKLVGATKFVITGHTDSTGSKSANQKLSENRASAVQKYISASIKKASFKWNGFADSTPAASNNSVAGQAANRRVEVKIS